MKMKQVYYSVHALPDGTVWLGIPTRKPRATKYGGTPKIDEEGVCDWYFEKPKEQLGLNEARKTVRLVCIATCLNMRRLIRERIEERFTALEVSIGETRTQLTRLEDKVDRLLNGLGNGTEVLPPKE
jgi:hypothetical protein